MNRADVPVMEPAVSWSERLRRLAVRLASDSLARNSLYIMGTTVVTAALGYVYWIAAARTYPTAAVGVAATLLSALQLASAIALFGISSTLVQTLPGRARGRDWSVAVNAGLTASLACGLVVGIALVFVLPAVSSALDVVRDPFLALWIVGGVALGTVSTVVDRVYIAVRAAGHMLARNTVFAALKIPLLLIPVVGLYGRLSAGTIVVSWVLASAASTVIGYRLIARLGHDYGRHMRGLLAEGRTLVASLAGNHLINLGGAAPMYVLPALVTARLVPTETAYFYTTWMVGSLFFMVSPAVAEALFAEGAHASEALERSVRRSLAIIALLLVPAMIVFLIAGPFIMEVFGPAYPRHGALLLVLLILSAIPDALTNVGVSVLRVSGRLRFASTLNMGMAAWTLIGAWILLPSLGIAAIGWAWLSAQTLGALALIGPLVRSRRARHGV